MHVTISPEVYCQSLDQEAVLLDLGAGSYFGLDPMAAHLWRLLEEHGETDAVLAATLQEYDVDETTLQKDLQEWLRELASLGLVSLEGEGAQ